ncbi:MAG: nitronate monooxygenase [Sulfitobacter sp.]
MHPFFESIGAKYPLIQAPMAGAQDEELAIAVSQSGGIGSIPCAGLTPERLKASADRFHKATSGPVNLNFFCHKVVERDPQREAIWLRELAPFYDAHALTPDYPKTGFSRALDEEMVKVVCTLNPAIASFHFGLPKTEYLDRIRTSGAKIIATATTIKEALFLEEQGCDAVIAQGREAGGHQGAFLASENPLRQSTMDLVHQISSAVVIPVIAAGGIADIVSIRAAIDAGASGVQIGTRFLKSPEARITPLHRSFLEGNEDLDTEITNVFTGRPARGFVNKLVRELGPINPNVQTFPLAISALAPLKSATAGTADFTSLWAGQNWKTGDAKPAKQIVKQLSTAFDLS